MPQSEIHLKQLLYGSWKEDIPNAKCRHLFSWFVFQCWMLHRTWSLLTHPTNPWTRRGCRLCLTQGWMTCRRGNNLQSPDGSEAAKGGAAGSERESACLHTASMAPPSVAPSETALSQKVDLDSATWMLLVYFSMCRTWNTQHLVCSRDTKYLNLITSSIHSKYVNIYFWQIFVYRKILKKGEFVGVFISNTWTSLKQSLILYLTTSIL